MTNTERKEWIDRIEDFLGKVPGGASGMLNKLKGFGAEILGKAEGVLPGDIKEKAEDALKLLKDPSASDDQLQSALAPIKSLLPELKH